MTAVTIDESNNRVNAAEATTGWSKIGNSLTQEPDFVYQGAFAVSSKVGTATGGHYHVPTGFDMTAGDNKVWLVKALATNSSVLDEEGMVIRIGSGTTDYYTFNLADGTNTNRIYEPYPIKGGWIVTAIDPNVAEWRDTTVGSPVLTAVDYMGHTGNFSSASKSENVVTDAIDLGDGLYLVGGDGGDADGLFQDFIDDDEGEATAGRFGHVTTRESILYVHGKLAIGRTAGATVTATEFTDAARTLIFPGGKVAAGWNLLEVDAGNAATIVTWTNISVIGRGRNDLKIWFDSDDEVVEGAADHIVIPAGALVHGEAFLYSDEGGTAVVGLTDNTQYFASFSGGADTQMRVHTVKDEAYIPTNDVALTSAATGQQHSIRRQPDTRPDITVVGTAGTFDAINCVFENCRTITLTSAAELTDCTIIGSKSIVPAGGLITGCRLITPLLAEGEAFVITSDMADISDTAFTGGATGHAIEIDMAGTYGFAGNTFASYGPVRQDFHSNDDVTGGATDTVGIAGHPYSTGDAVYYSDEGGAQAIGLTDQDRYYVNSVDGSTISLHVTKQDATTDTNRVDLTAGGTETHTFYSADAAVYNSTSGTVQINVSGGGASNFSYRNAAGATTTIVDTKDVIVSGVTEGSAITIIAAATVGSVTIGDVLTSQLADAAGEIMYDHIYEGDLAVTIRARSSGLPSAAVADDNGVFTDETTAANSTTADDMTLLPTTPVVNEDRYQLGHAEKFDSLSIEVSTVGTGGFTITWEYWDGDSWESLSATDNTSSFSVAGTNKVTWTIPGDWATRIDNGQGPFYYVRAAYTAGTVTVTPVGRKCSLNVTRYLPFTQSRTITSTGLNVVATWIEDTIATF